MLKSLIFLDNKISEGVVFLRSDFWDQFFLIFTKLGSWYVIAILFVLLSVIFYFYNRRSLILPFFVVIAGSGIMTIIVKYLVDRARPGAGIALYIEKLPSFPSAHAALILALFGFLIYCVWRFDFKIAIKIILSLIFFTIIILIGFSRLYLGVHFLSDIIAGYLTGLMWVLIGMYISRSRF
jgi:membrane-associated phospholipid phosphatase